MWEAAEAAGAVPQVVYAKIDIPRFSSIYSAKGPWALLHSLSDVDAHSGGHQPEPALAANPAQAPAAVTTGQQPGVALEAITKVVRDAALSILGADSVEGAQLPASRPLRWLLS